MFRQFSTALYPPFTGNSRKMFLYFLFLPNCAMSFMLFMLIVLQIGVDQTNDSMWPCIPLILYGLFVGFLMIAMAIYTIKTWKRVHDNIYVRGELVCQEIILSTGLLTLCIIYNIDRHELSPENERFDSLYYFGYFLVLTVMAFTSLIVSTQWLPMQPRRKEMVQELMHFQQGEEFRNIDFYSMISAPDAFDILLQHLHKENLINHFAVQCLFRVQLIRVTMDVLHVSPRTDCIRTFVIYILYKSPMVDCAQFAVEVIYCIASLLHENYHLPNLEQCYRNGLMNKVTKYTGFCTKVPRPDVIFNSEATPRRMFIALYEKYELSPTLRAKYLRYKEREKQERRHHTARHSDTIDLPNELSINDILLSTEPIHNFADEDKKELADIVRLLDSMIIPVMNRLEQAIDALKTRDDFMTSFVALNHDQRERIARAHSAGSTDIHLPDPREIQIELSDVEEWDCDACGCRNTFIGIGNSYQDPQKDCICCGPKNEMMNTQNLLSGSADENLLLRWSALKSELAYDPNNTACTGLTIDGCRYVQILWFFMECYVHYVDAPIGDNEDRFKIDSMYILVNELLDSEHGLDELIKMFHHIYSVHFQPALADLYREPFPRELHSGSNLSENFQSDSSVVHTRIFSSISTRAVTCHRTNCSMHRRNRYCRTYDQRLVNSRSKSQGMAPYTFDVEYQGQRGRKIDDPKERVAMMLFDQWHSTFYHPIYPLQSSESITSDIEITPQNQHKFWTDNQYGFGEQIEYHKESPGFPNFKEELLNNKVHRITVRSWTDTLEKARFLRRSFQTDYVAVEPRTEEEKEHYDQYAVRPELPIGIENVIAIVLYCDFDELQAAFSRTFRKTREKHCHNFYWLGRYVLSLCSLTLSLSTSL